MGAIVKIYTNTDKNSKNRSWISFNSIDKFTQNDDEKQELLELLFSEINNSDIVMSDFDDTIAKNISMYPMIYELSKQFFEKPLNLSKWLIKSTVKYVQNTESKMEIVYDFIKKYMRGNQKRFDEIEKMSSKLKIKQFPYSKEFFENIDYKVLLTDSLDEIINTAFSTPQNKSKISEFDQIVCASAKKERCVDEILNKYIESMSDETKNYELKTEPLRVIYIGDDYPDLLAIKKLKGLEKIKYCHSIQVCNSKKQINTEFDISIGRNFYPLILTNNYKQFQETFK